MLNPINSSAGFPSLRKDYGIKPGTSIDQTAVVQAAINAEPIILFDSGNYLVTGLEIPDGHVVLGAGAGHTILYAATTSKAISLGIRSKVADLTIYPAAGYEYKYTGLVQEGVQDSIMDNVLIYKPDVGLRVKGKSYYNQGWNLTVINANSKCIEFVESGGFEPNANHYHIRRMNGNNKPGSIGIDILGNANMFEVGEVGTGGDPANALLTMFHADTATGLPVINWIRGAFCELSHNFTLAHVEHGYLWLDVKSASGLSNFIVENNPLTGILGPHNGYSPFLEVHPYSMPLRYLKCLLPFTDGKGGIITDKSGNGKNGTLAGNYSWVEGISSYAVRLQRSAIAGKISLPRDTFDPTIAYTMAIAWKLVTPSTAANLNYLLDVKGAGINQNLVAKVVDFNTSVNKYWTTWMWRDNGAFSQGPVNGSSWWVNNWNWLFVHVDPVQGKLVSLDPTGVWYNRPTSFTNPIRAIDGILIGAATAGVQPTAGETDIACVAIWQKGSSDWSGLTPDEAREFCNGAKYLPLVRF